MKPINKDIRNKSILKAGIWTTLALLIMLFCFDSCYQQKMKGVSAELRKEYQDSLKIEKSIYVNKIDSINNNANNKDSEFVKEISIKKSIHLALTKIDSSFKEAKIQNNAYLERCEHRPPGYLDFKQQADNAIDIIKSNLDSIEMYQQASGEFRNVYTTTFKLLSNFEILLKETRDCYEHPPKPDCSLCPHDLSQCEPCPASEECPQEWRRIVGNLLRTIDTKKSEIRQIDGLNKNRRQKEAYERLLANDVKPELNRALQANN